ncbi:DMT family transporter [Campylobacter sp. RM9344]|uniref:DMT family transporter n=1 Tax=Campylobacter californiensis TaxID=1032243 RepID=A0AAW3ZQX1_9BACT|nr:MULTISPECIES: DMT family transporter [unclassified Campylobacter]MBE2984546.1 DMT family transporter [Campylobacter sp. RM6883]MBE2987201.1 DMT family transporter [Campylobacter sp. RM12919]MBE2988888.1 DMT family transporter [Campylobacter sp. RM12920]MBE2995166.1 DMT family transporter [Campylobacter sp. RM6913]MBE3029087.1 DMT family transporter [Campylobacter sp. RM9344]
MLRNLSTKETYADLALIATAIVWGATFLPMATATQTNGVFTLLFWRFLIACFIMAFIAFKFDKKFDINSIKYGLILGVILFFGFASQTFAFKFAQSANVAFISGLNVVIVPFVVYAFFRERISIYAYIGVALGCIGLYFLSDPSVSFGKGEALSIVCAFAWAFHIVFTSFYAKKCELFTLLATQFGVIIVLSAIFAFAFEDGITPNLDYAFYKAMVISILFATIFGFIMQATMLKLTTPVKAALIFTLEPVSAGVLGYFAGGEMFGVWQILGALIILAGILISEIGTILQKNSCAKTQAVHV